MTDVILKAKQLKKSFYNPSKVDIFTGIDLEVHRGETVAIMGRSGQGKSTLLQILGTLDKPCKGKLEIANYRVSFFNKAKIRNQHIGFIFQSFHLLDDYTAIDNILMPACIARKSTHSGSAAYNRGFELLDKVGLTNRADFPAKLLSGGEKQRIAIARAMCNDPDIIFADEPSGNLDDQTSEMIHHLLLSFAKEHGKTLVIVTHDNRLAELCETRYTLQEGKLTPQA